MRSTTCWLNSTLYHKTMSRFWPVWAGYGLLMAFILPLHLLQQFHYADQDINRMFRTAVNLAQLIGPFVLFLMAGCVLVAMGVYGYLYNSRSACMMHALPLRRETLFTTQYLAGLSMLILPVLLMAVLATFVEMAYLPRAHWALALSSLWALVLTIAVSSLFFFSLASFCAMFTGHILALPVFYAVANGAAMVLYILFSELARNFLFGFTTARATPILVEFLTPFFTLSRASDWIITYQDVPSQFDPTVLESLPIEAHLNEPATLAIYAVTALVLAGAALMLYKNRRIESAGDVVSIPAVRPLYQNGVSLAVGLGLGILTAMFFDLADHLLPLTLFVLIWAVAGWFAASMFLEKSFRVLKHWKGAVCMAAALALVSGALKFDLFGYERRIPAAEDVEQLVVEIDLGAPADSGSQVRLELTDPEQIQAFLSLHRTVAEGREQYRDNHSGQNLFSLDLTYHLKNGREMTRFYRYLPVNRNEPEDEGSLSQQYQAIVNDRKLVALAYGFDKMEQGQPVGLEIQGAMDRRIEDESSYVGFTPDNLTAQQITALWKAVRQDFDEGTMGVRYLIEDKERWENTYRTDLVFRVALPVESKYGDDLLYTDVTITLTPNAKHTLALLEEYDVFGEDYAIAPHTVGEMSGEVLNMDPNSAEIDLPVTQSVN